MAATIPDFSFSPGPDFSLSAFSFQDFSFCRNPLSAFQRFSFFPGPDFGLWTLDFARPLSAFQRFSFSRKLPQRSPRKSG
jgi:hypothetical protein